MRDLTLRNGTVLASGEVLPGRNDVVIRDGLIAAIGKDLEPAGEEIDCEGAWVGPGLVDVHTHLREPGQEWKETIESGSGAAAAGGYTAVVAMPNTDPAIDAGHLARYVQDRGRAVGLVDVMSAGCLTAGRRGEKLAHLDELWDAGVRLFTDDGDSVADAGLLRRAMEYLAERGGIVSEHCIDAGLAAGGQVHEGTVASRLGIAAIPREAEEIVIARDLALVRLTGCRYHVQHLSTAGAIALVAAAKAEGLPVTAEATPHHLCFDHRVVEESNPVYKMMPPLREPEDVAALRQAVRDGTIDLVGTDHAPHAAHEKDVPWEDAPFGVIGLEWAAAVVTTMVGLDQAAFFRVLSTTPARLVGFEQHGELAVGREGNVVVFDPAGSADTSRIVSMAPNAPYLGMELRGRVIHTVLRGRLTVRDGEVSQPVGATG